MTTQIQMLHRTKAWLAAGALLAALAGGVAAAPAQAFPTTRWGIDSTDSQSLNSAGGRFIWENRSVRVGAFLNRGSSDCLAVVFTAYDAEGRQVARAARPGDNKYLCSFDGRGYGFTLRASHVVGGIRTIVVDLYEGDALFHQHHGRKVYHRP